MSTGEIVTSVILIATLVGVCWYAWEARKQAKATQALAEATLTPILEQWVRDYPLPDRGGETALEIKYRNVGNGPAVRIRWTLVDIEGRSMNAPVHRRLGMGTHEDEDQFEYRDDVSLLRNGVRSVVEYESVFGVLWRSRLSLPSEKRSDGKDYLVNGEPFFERIRKRRIGVNS